ncbi:MAG: HlyD family efflux transporter periplasmic adaptor subunit, partial [bacterium]|nr:HlyD family efflux transporter periplasmic adaptor subunit [bacterium]
QKERNKQLQLGLDQAYDSLISQIDQWEQNYLLKSPIDGTASYTTIWSINQNVSAGDVVVTVVPENSGHLIGKVVLPMQGSGKVKEGQDVNIKFMSYPHMEYGMVYGRINSKSLVTSDNNYVLEVALPNGLITSYKKKLIFSQNMIGTAEIITDDIRLMERIFTPIKSIIKRMNKRPELEGLEEYDPEAEEKAKKEKAEAEKKKAEEAAAKPETTESSEEK